MKKCSWCHGNNLMEKYHDEEWGKPLHDDTRLFEALILDGAQAGLSWQTILNKRENYRKAFDNFDAEKIAKYNNKKVEELMQNTGIIRNRLKINSAIGNAKAFLEIQKEFGSFDKYLWSFVGGKPIKNKFKTWKDVPATSKESDALSKDMKKRGFKFVGSTIVYAAMQGVGMVNDHEVSCFRYKEV
ncbi:MAG: DNA-3-methyladenine glycosylase I [archaeon]